MKARVPLLRGIGRDRDVCWRAMLRLFDGFVLIPPVFIGRGYREFSPVLFQLSAFFIQVLLILLSVGGNVLIGDFIVRGNRLVG